MTQYEKDFEIKLPKGYTGEYAKKQRKKGSMKGKIIIKHDTKEKRQQV